jgi:uncharacterized SAM-binding protein YcdF (DUF218 family)
MLQILRSLASPIGLTWLGLLALVVWLCVRRKRPLAILPGVAFVVITIIGNTPATAHLLAGLERPYARKDWSTLPACDAVVMLGGTHRPSGADVFGFDLAAVGDRVLTAAELVRQRKAPVLVLSSGGYKQGGKLVPASLLLERWLKAWGVPQAPILHLGACNDTRDEAARTMELVRQRQWKRVILVTSANHMRRSEGVFRKAGVDVVCVGCDFEGIGALESEQQYFLTPQTEPFGRLNQVVHEWFGWYYYRLRGWV